MSTGRLVLDPAVGWLWLGLFAAVAATATAPALWRRARGAVLRGLGFLLLLGILAGPSWTAATRRPLPDIALLLVDHSQSMALGQRAVLARNAAAVLTASAAGVEAHIVDVPPAPDGGTALFGALHDAEAAIPPHQLAGVIAVTDGEVSDLPALSPSRPPFTALLAAAHEETDRELHLIDSPSYGLTGQTVKLRFVVLDHGVADHGAAVPVTVSEDGRLLTHLSVTVGAPTRLDLPVSHAGPIIVQIAADPLPGEVSPINDQAVFTLNGIQRRLNILLISGSPDPGVRAWRVLLKTDPAIQLVHFTILRTPGEAIDASPDDLALVPFPVQQLFESDIGKFDLIILDRFNPAGLLPERYLANIAAYVQNGGALLAELGPEFTSAESLAFSSLGTVLPAQPADPGALSTSFSPHITAIGVRHPVTAPFAKMILAPWPSMEAAIATAGDVLMTGPNNAPLLILGPAGKGRVGVLLSDQLWLWTRGPPHSGPALPLLRRIVHWLLREPALEAEALSASNVGGQLVVDRQTISATPPAAVEATDPTGRTTALPLHSIGSGQYQARVAQPEPGVWKFADGPLTTYAATPLPNPVEYQNLAATAVILRPFGNIVWLGRSSVPPLRDLIRPRHASAITGSSRIPLLPPLPSVVILLAVLAGAWWREAR